nr:hypothetical protein [Psychrobacter pasteurii]
MTETQIVSILKEAEAGIPAKSCAANTVLLARPSINGDPSMEAWKRLTSND